MCPAVKHSLPYVPIVEFSKTFYGMSNQNYQGGHSFSSDCSGCYSCYNMVKAALETTNIGASPIRTNERATQVITSRVQSPAFSRPTKRPNVLLRPSAQSQNWREKSNPEVTPTFSAIQASSSNVALSSAEAISGLVPLNQEHQRLDTDVHPPTEADSQTFRENYGARPNLCRSHHLEGKSHHHDKCTYDHDDDITPGHLCVFRYMMKRRPCPRGSTCRDATCPLGHTCVRSKCKQGDECAMKEFHGVDLIIACWVPGIEDWRRQDNAK